MSYIPLNDETGIANQTYVNDKEGCYYDLQGRRLAAPPTEGVYISGGRKYVKTSR